MIKQRINVTLPSELLATIKSEAEINCRSVSEEIEYRLKNYVPAVVFTPTPTPTFITHDTPGGIQTTENPTGAPTITSQSQSPEDTFQTLAKKIVGHKLDLDECVLLPDNTYYSYAEELPDTFARYPYTMPQDKQVEYLEEWKHYEK